MRDNERQRMRTKVANRPLVLSIDNKKRVHKKQLTGITNFDPHELDAFKNSVAKSDGDTMRQNSTVESRTSREGSRRRGSRKLSVTDQINADIVLKAARRASLMMGVNH
jgi:hypothetical protein